MSALTTSLGQGASPAAFGALKAKLRETWMAGDYDVFSRYMQRGAEQFVERLPISPGTRLLDVACGAGQAALLAARAGAIVTGCDIAPNWLEKARTRASTEGLRIVFEEGDAEMLPYADGQFDVVVSLVGAMFAPQPDRVAYQLARVCRAGGTIVMGNWTPGGFIGQMLQVIARYIAPGGMPSPLLWGDEDTVRERLKGAVSDLRCTRRLYPFEYPFGPGEVVEFFRINYGPMARAFAALDVHRQQQLHDQLVRLWSTENRCRGSLGGGCTRVDAEYLEVVGTRT